MGATVGDDVGRDGGGRPVDRRRSSFGYYDEDGTYVNTSRWSVGISRADHDRYLVALADREGREAAEREARDAKETMIGRALDTSEAHFSALADDGPEEGRAAALDTLNGLRAVRGRPPLPPVPDPGLTALAEPTRLLAGLRDGGWTVGVHNDYRLGGVAHTFWLMTHADGTFLKGEGVTDLEAIRQVAAQVAERTARSLRRHGDEE